MLEAYTLNSVFFERFDSCVPPRRQPDAIRAGHSAPGRPPPAAHPHRRTHPLQPRTCETNSLFSISTWKKTASTPLISTPGTLVDVEPPTSMADIDTCAFGSRIRQCNFVFQTLRIRRRKRLRARRDRRHPPPTDRSPSTSNSSTRTGTSTSRWVIRSATPRFFRSSPPPRHAADLDIDSGPKVAAQSLEVSQRPSDRSSTSADFTPSARGSPPCSPANPSSSKSSTSAL